MPGSIGGSPAPASAAARRRSDARENSSQWQARSGISRSGNRARTRSVPERVFDQRRILVALPARIGVRERGLRKSLQRRMGSWGQGRTPEELVRGGNEGVGVAGARGLRGEVERPQCVAGRLPPRAKGRGVEPAIVVPARDVRRIEELL